MEFTVNRIPERPKGRFRGCGCHISLLDDMPCNLAPGKITGIHYYYHQWSPRPVVWNLRPAIWALSRSKSCVYRATLWRNHFKGMKECLTKC